MSEFYFGEFFSVKDGVSSTRLITGRTLDMILEKIKMELADIFNTLSEDSLTETEAKELEAVAEMQTADEKFIREFRIDFDLSKFYCVDFCSSPEEYVAFAKHLAEKCCDKLNIDFNEVMSDPEYDPEYGYSVYKIQQQSEQLADDPENIRLLMSLIASAEYLYDEADNQMRW